MNTVERILEDTRFDMACTYIVQCMGITEIFTREKNKLFKMWGKEEAKVYFLNTREVVIDIQ